MSDNEILEIELEEMRIRAAEAEGHPYSSESPDNFGEGYGGEISETNEPATSNDVLLQTLASLESSAVIMCREG